MEKGNGPTKIAKAEENPSPPGHRRVSAFSGRGVAIHVHFGVARTVPWWIVSPDLLSGGSS
jgi:hypothetical protein